MSPSLLMVVLLLVALTAAAPLVHDQRQQGGDNMHVKVENVAVVIVPGGSGRKTSVVQALRHHNAEEPRSKEPLNVATNLKAVEESEVKEAKQ